MTGVDRIKEVRQLKYVNDLAIREISRQVHLSRNTIRKILRNEATKFTYQRTNAYPCWVYGPGDVTFVPLIADAIKKGELIFWRKNIIIWPAYVGNVVDLLMIISEHPKAAGQLFLVHDGESDTFQNFSSEIAEIYWSKEACITYSLLDCLRGFLDYGIHMETSGQQISSPITKYAVKNLGSRFRFSIRKAEKLIGWLPPISYWEGFIKTMEWLKRTDPEVWKQK